MHNPSLFKSSPCAAASLWCGIGVIALCIMWAVMAGGSESGAKMAGDEAWFVLLIVGAYAAAIGGVTLTLGGVVLSALSMIRGEGRTGLALLGLLLSVGPVLFLVIVLADVF